MEQFTANINNTGGITIAAGVVIDLGAATTTVFTIQERVITPGADRQTQYVGGAPDDVTYDVTTTSTLAPVGILRKDNSTTWVSGSVSIVFDWGTGDASMFVGTDEIATATGLTDPAGTYNSTTLGETNYNSGNPFTVAVTYNGGSTQGVEILCPVALFTTTLAPVGFWEEVMSRDTHNTWVNGAWTLTSGDVETALDDGIDTVATGDPMTNGTPPRLLTSTTYGETLLEVDPFEVKLFNQTIFPIEGYFYLTLNLTAGVLDSVTGPHFATSLPANSATEEHIPICHSDGTGKVLQIHSGPIHYRSA